jgi:Right handed beta helix region
MSNSNDASAEKKTNKVINVDKDFAGNLDQAIAVANDGDTIMLGKSIYTTSGINLHKDITIDGYRGKTIIKGEGATDSIITINREASGSTIQDVIITNGNNGINGKEATNVTLQNLDIHHIGIDKPVRDGQNNIAINLTGADGFKILDSEISDIGRKGISINDTDGGIVSGITLEDINLEAEHSQSFDAAGIKLFNTNNVTVSDNKLSGINAFNIWNDITSNTSIYGNEIRRVGEDFLAPDYNKNVGLAGIYNEKSYESIVDNNIVTSTKDFLAFDATEFTTKTMKLGDNNDFSSMEINTRDYWANEKLETLVAITEDPDAADFSLFEDDFYNGGTFGGDTTGGT